MSYCLHMKMGELIRRSSSVSSNKPGDTEEPGIVTATEMEYFEDDLYECIVNNKFKNVTEYIKCGLNVNHAFRSTERLDRLGKTMVEVAVSNGATDVVKALVAKKVDVNLVYVVNVNQFSYQLEEYRKPDRLKLTCMYPCIVKNDLIMIKLLVNGGFDVNLYDDRGCNSIWHATDLNNYEMLKLMSSGKGADVNKPDNAKLNPLHIASMKGNVKMTSLLIRSGANVDAIQLRGSTPLILACRAGDFDTVKMLLLNGANPNQVGYNGHNVISTALQFTSETRIPELLICCGALIDLELIQICRKEGKKFQCLKHHPEFFEVMKQFASTPRDLRTLCCLQIRRLLVHSSTRLHLIKKVELLPLPRLIKDYLLLFHL